MKNLDAVSMDALLPPAMAAKAEAVGVAKAAQPVLSLFVLAILAGAFIGLGAMFATTVSAGSAGVVPWGISRLLAGLAFSLGLILVIVGGAELFTGNNLIVMAWASGRIGAGAVLRNWVIVYAGNFVGSVGTAILVYLSGQPSFGGGAVRETAITIATGKCGLGFGQAIVLGVLCNTLVCLAVWMCFSARTTTDRILAIVPPIAAFVAAGFEHSVANMYFVPLALMLTGGGEGDLTVMRFLVGNLLPVTIGNIIGGAGLVGAVYWAVYLRHRRS